ncbi:MAG: hypothetical protein WBG43_12945 [Marinifilaceae bacterium]
MKKIILVGVAVIIVVISYIFYVDLTYSPLKDKDFKQLFKQSLDVKRLSSIDFLGFNVRGEFFEIYKYSVGEIEINNELSNIKVWENNEITRSTIIQKWQNCPIDSLSAKLYDFMLTVNDFKKWDCLKTLNNSLKDSQNYYCYIYFDESEQYFLLCNIKEEALYYIRKKGF